MIKSIDFTNELIGFLDKSPVNFIAVNNFKEMLVSRGYTELKESEEWDVKAGGDYFVTRNGSAVIAFRVPESPEAFAIIAAHSDSPGLKIKPNAEIRVEDRYVKLNVEQYGGLIMSTWFDRPLSVAGKAAVKTKSGIEMKLVNIDRDLLIIPSLAIHMNRSVNDGYAFNIQKDLLPLFSGGGNGKTFIETVADSIDVKADEIIGTDLFLYTRVHGKVWGRDNEFFSSQRIDDLQCAYTGMRALIDSKPTKSVKMCCVFDNEEVGSGTKQGAKSTFMHDVMIRVCKCLGMDESGMLRMLASSFMVSADNGHAVHPNYTDKACPTNRPYVNGGVLVKYNAQQKYTTDAVSEGIFLKICEDAKVPYQRYVNRSDILGGSTLGNLSTEQVSINTVDIGTAQLAMHSAYETAGVDDALHLYNGMKAFYDVSITAKSDGVYDIN